MPVKNGYMCNVVQVTTGRDMCCCEQKWFVLHGSSCCLDRRGGDNFCLEERHLFRSATLLLGGDAKKCCLSATPCNIELYYAPILLLTVQAYECIIRFQPQYSTKFFIFLFWCHRQQHKKMHLELLLLSVELSLTACEYEVAE